MHLTGANLKGYQIFDSFDCKRLLKKTQTGGDMKKGDFQRRQSFNKLRLQSSLRREVN